MENYSRDQLKHKPLLGFTSFLKMQLLQEIKKPIHHFNHMRLNQQRKTKQFNDIKGDNKVVVLKCFNLCVKPLQLTHSNMKWIYTDITERNNLLLYLYGNRFKLSC